MSKHFTFDATIKGYIKEIGEASLLNAEEERSLGKLVSEENDQWAREQLVRGNLKLVVHIAKKYSGRGMSLGDLIEEGNLGLITAVDYFDPDRGVRFSTYAAWWIKQGIKSALLANIQPVHIPTYMIALVNQWRHITAKLESELGRILSVEEIAEIMELSLRKARTVHRTVNVLSSISESFGNVPDEDQIEMVLEDPNAERPEDALTAVEEQVKALKLLNELDPREASILKSHYGLDGNAPMPLKEIAKKLGLTRERIRQIRRDALTELHKKWQT